MDLVNSYKPGLYLSIVGLDDITQKNTVFFYLKWVGRPHNFPNFCENQNISSNIWSHPDIMIHSNVDFCEGEENSQ